MRDPRTVTLPTDHLRWLLNKFSTTVHAAEHDEGMSNNPVALCGARPMKMGYYWDNVRIERFDMVVPQDRVRCDACQQEILARMAAGGWASHAFITSREIESAWRELKELARLPRFVGVRLERQVGGGPWVRILTGSRKEVVAMVKALDGAPAPGRFRLTAPGHRTR